MGILKDRRVPAIVNGLCFVIVVVLGALFFVSPFRAVHRGLFCDDETIRYPYNTETITVPVLVATCYGVTFLLVLTLEVLYGVLTNKLSSGKDGSPDDKHSRYQGLVCGLYKAGKLIACNTYGNLLCFVVTEIFKISFGRLRPSFLSVCHPSPDVTTFANCTGLYLEDIVCTNPDTALLKDMRKSFISGHSSTAAFNMAYIILYLQLRLPSSTPKLMVSLLQSCALGYGVFVAATRVYDNYHHPGDVVGGALLGIIGAWVTMYKISPAFGRHPPRHELDLLPTSVNSKPGSAHTAVHMHTKEKE